MPETIPKTLRTALIIFFFLAASFLISTKVHGFRMENISYQQDPAVNKPDWEITKTTKAQQPVIQTPEKDECLHCHISGSDESLWTPLARWSLFGSAFVFSVFGFTRSAWVWKNRTKWVPITTRVGNWINDRYQTQEALTKIFNKPVPNWATRWWYCLGGITAFLFVIQSVTGIMLAFYYQPTPDHAYASIQYIENEVMFGSSIRAIHHWSANGMVIMCVAHMLRVFILGAFKPPRELNWVSGVVLFIVTMGFGFTGYLLPWDQRAYWATTVGTEIAGGIPDIGELILVFLRVGWGITAATLSRFYALHIIVLPVMVIVMMGAHFMMIRRQGLKEPL